MANDPRQGKRSLEERISQNVQGIGKDICTCSHHKDKHMPFVANGKCFEKGCTCKAYTPSVK